MSEEKDVKVEKKKQIPLRLSTTLNAELSQWAEEEFRSLNGQIEYLLTQAVNERKKPKKLGENNEKNYI